MNFSPPPVVQDIPMYHVFQGYAPYGEIFQKEREGSLVAFEAGTTTAHGLNSILDRGNFSWPGVKFMKAHD